MKILKSLAIGLVALALMPGCNAQTAEKNSETTTQSTTAVINKDVTAQEFKALMDKKEGQLIDVRTDGEFAEGHLKGATQMDIGSRDFDQKIATLDKNQPVYVYCRSGARSGRAAKTMKEMGFTEVYNLEGGISAWQGAGNEIEK